MGPVQKHSLLVQMSMQKHSSLVQTSMDRKYFSLVQTSMDQKHSLLAQTLIDRKGPLRNHRQAVQKYSSVVLSTLVRPHSSSHPAEKYS